MSNIKKAIIASTSFLLAFIFFLCILFELFFNSKMQSWNDRETRADLSGSVDFIINGSCHCVYGFDPRIVDSRLKVNSYNLSGPEINWCERKYLLDDMLDDNPVKTIVFEIAYDNLVRTIDESYWGTVYFLSRMNSFSERFPAFFQWTKFSEYDDAIKELTSNSSDYFIRTVENKAAVFLNKLCGTELKLHDIDNYDSSTKGYIPYSPENLTFSDKEIFELYNSLTVESTFNKETLDIFDQVMSICKNNNLEVFFVVAPIPPNKLWEVTNFDEFRYNLKELSEKYDYPCFGFNLVKNYKELFSSKYSFHDEFHLSESGVKEFTNLLCDTIIAYRKGENTSKLFFNTYTEAKEHSEYMEILKGD